jgi:hypothetical protein
MDSQPTARTLPGERDGMLRRNHYFFMLETLPEPEQLRCALIPIPLCAH